MNQKQGKVVDSFVGNLPISISRIGNQTLAAVLTGDGQMYYGTSCPTSEDKFDAAIGHDLAIGRALRAFSDDLIKAAEGQVKHNDDVRAHSAAAAQRREKREKAQEAARKAHQTRAANKLNDEAEVLKAKRSEAGRKAAATRARNRAERDALAFGPACGGSAELVELEMKKLSDEKNSVKRGKKRFVMTPAREAALVKAREKLAASRAAAKENASS